MPEHTNRLDRNGNLVTPLDDLRSIDVGIVASFGGAAPTSAPLFTVQSGMQAYVQQLILTPFSGQFGAVRLLDLTTARTLPIAIETKVLASGPLPMQVVAPTQVVPGAPFGRFLSSIHIETVSGVVPANGMSSLFAGSVMAVVRVDPLRAE